MAGHELFYVPYATLTDKQLPLLKVAALYFDRFWLLDPDGASWNTIGADDDVRDGLRLLGPSGIVDVISPTDVLAKYERELSEAVRGDLADPAFLELCSSHARHREDPLDAVAREGTLRRAVGTPHAAIAGARGSSTLRRCRRNHGGRRQWPGGSLRPSLRTTFVTTPSKVRPTTSGESSAAAASIAMRTCPLRSASRS